MVKDIPYKVGKVALVGRPNAGKSTLLNNLVGQKIAIVSPKPQTTQSRISALYEDERGQIFLRDTPGLFTSNLGLKQGKSIIRKAISDADVLVYVIDHSRSWGREEEEIKDIVLETKKPYVLVINKIDIYSPTYQELYLEKLESSAIQTVETSAIKNKGIKNLVNTLFSLIPEGKRDESVDEFVSPLLSQNSTEFLEEVIREKIFLLTRQEVPYQTTPHVTSVVSNEIRNILKIKGYIEVNDDKYKPILIGHRGSKIKEISEAVRKELEITTGKKIYIRLKVTA
jgi:GTPase